MIQVQNITFSYTEDILYQNASFYIPKNKKAGLVGLNGAGKSTLFKLLLKEEWPDDGKISIEGRIHLVPQEVKKDSIQNQFESIRDYLNHAKPQADDQLTDLLDHMELEEVNLSDNPNQLSGGQKTKLAILYAVLSQPDILLLDEPTNFLDEAGKKWVMHWLAQYQKTLLIVSHDLDLLDRSIHKVIYINKQTKSFEEYTGTYTQFKKLKKDRDQHLTRYIKNQEQKINRMKKSIQKMQGRKTEKGVHQRIQLEKRLKKIEDKLPELPQELIHISINLPEPAHIGSLPLMVKHIAKSYDDHQILCDTTFSIERNQRIALIGHNGAGKSTLIKIILSKIKPDTGLVEVDERAKIGFYSQEFETFDYNQTVFNTVKASAPVSESQIRSFLHRFMFSKKLDQTIGSLSGGEKTRLSIAMLMLKDYNFLILDEPTTYLDVLSQRIILEALKKYQGTMIIVSHTPEFLKELNLDKALLLPQEQYVYWDNNLLETASELE